MKKINIYELDKVIHDLDAAIQRNPEDAKAYSTRGDAYLQKGEYDRAIADYNAAIKLDPTAERWFQIALKLGYGDRDKINQHLENLKT